MLALFALVLSLVIASSESFLLTRVDPRLVAVQCGKSIDLLCVVDSDYEFCRWINPRQQYCDFDWNRVTGNVTTEKCQIPNKVSFHGRYNDRECGIRINSASMEDTGKWRCELENFSFIIGGRGSGEVRHSQIEVKVLETSTPTSTYLNLNPACLPPPLKKPIGAVKRGMSKNRADIEKILEAMTQQEKRSSYLEKSIGISGGVLALVILLIVVYVLIKTGLVTCCNSNSNARSTEDQQTRGREEPPNNHEVNILPLNQVAALMNEAREENMALRMQLRGSRPELQPSASEDRYPVL